MRIEVELPVSEDALDAEAKERLHKDVLEAAVLRLFDERRISSAEACRQLGLTRIAFMELARQRGVPMYDYTFDDWREDSETIDRLWPEIEKRSEDGRARSLK